MNYSNNSLINQLGFNIQSTPVISKPDITKYPLIAKCDTSPGVLNACIFTAYNEYTVISKEYTGPLDFISIIHDIVLEIF